MATRWGIIGAGKISSDFVQSLSTLPASEHLVVSVAARKLESAQEFAQRYNISTAYDSYEDLTKDSNIDAIYVGTIHPYHFDVAKMIVTAGKPVLCEKPLCVNLQQTKELVNLAREKKVFLMEAIWTRFLPAIAFVRNELKAGTIGEVLQVFSSFGMKAANVDRLRLKELGGGTVLDLGIYTVHLATMVFGIERPEKILAGGHLNEHGVDESSSTTLVYRDGRMATLNTHCCVDLPCEAHIIGTEGTIKLSAPMHVPVNVTTPSQTHKFSYPEASRPFNFIYSGGLRYEAMEVRRCLQEGLMESPLMTLEETLLIAEILETIRKQIGVVYDQDVSRVDQ